MAVLELRLTSSPQLVCGGQVETEPHSDASPILLLHDGEHTLTANGLLEASMLKRDENQRPNSHFPSPTLPLLTPPQLSQTDTAPN